MSGSHDEESEDERYAGRSVSNKLGKVGCQKTGDLASLDPEKHHISSSVKPPSACAPSTLKKKI